MDDCLELESDPRMVIAARQFVRDRLSSWEATDRLEPAVLVASELVTNAVLHARTAIQLKVIVDGPKVRIEVYDENSRLPVQAACPPDATSGRGLALVSTLATTWGIDNRGDGKVVWAELGPAGPADTPEDCVDLSGINTVDQAFRQIEQNNPDSASH